MTYTACTVSYGELYRHRDDRTMYITEKLKHYNTGFGKILDMCWPLSMQLLKVKYHLVIHVILLCVVY